MTDFNANDIKYEFIYESTEENIMPLGGLPLILYLIEQTNLIKRVNKVPFRDNAKPIISNGDIMKSIIGIVAQGKFDYAAINNLRNDPFFKEALNIHNVPSQERLRQRLDIMNPCIKDILDEESVNLIRKSNMPLTPTFKNLIPVDIDVSPFDNSNTKKEKCNCTYKLVDGFAPMFAYIGNEGYMLHCEFREGKQHSQDGTRDFLEECIKRTKIITDERVLFRMDSGNDALENMQLFLQEKVDFLVKRNLRRGKNGVIDKVLQNGEKGKVRIDGKYKKLMYYHKDTKILKVNGEKKEIYVYSRVKEIVEDKNGQQMLFPEYEIESYYSTLDVSVEDIMEIYHMHGTCEQFHSELKTDMNIERMPSGKFATNDLLLHIAMFTYNLLRIIGQISLMNDRSKREKNHMITRRRLSTVIKNIVMMAAKFVRHARKKYIKSSKHNIWLGITSRAYMHLNAMFN